MVVKLEGIIDGIPVIFNWKEGNLWEIKVPPSLTGVYIVELKAYDEAGNMAYVTLYVVTIDISSLKVKIEPYPYWFELVNTGIAKQSRRHNMTNMKVRFDLGETQHVKLKVHCLKHDNFVIEHAKYDLIKNGCNVPESSGICTIQDHIIDTVITPLEKAPYRLKITYNILDETLIDVVEVVVM